jgi:hypothetical protein
MILILSWTNSLNIPATYFSNIHLILCSHSCLSPQDALFHSGVLIKMLYFSLFRTVLQIILISSFFYLTVLDVQINFSAYNFELSVMCPHYSLHRLPTASHTLLWHNMLYSLCHIHSEVFRSSLKPDVIATPRVSMNHSWVVLSTDNTSEGNVTAINNNKHSH